ncbi:DNA translocase FtsK 4TM domain-containing protein [Candidatus Profftia lariciata]|uniref:DNA translocase FtsK 4TM domain-containing protein n=1 Tax=Candidatus Profftia lariciata TaxID=1987921 RepID=UPI001D00B8C7|nr:DNA translocase FtsK 4TM domain-containing protein [Candidatus Profftia lariciata]
MHQKYVDNKKSIFKKNNNQHLIYQILQIIGALFSIYFMIALLSFNPSDPSWLQISDKTFINNIGGLLGSWLSDTVFCIFGLIGYCIPPCIFILCYFSKYKYNNSSYINYYAISIKIISMFLFILSSCGLITLITTSNLDYFPLGGIVGGLLSYYLLTTFGANNIIGSIFFLLGIWFISFILFTGSSWLIFLKNRFFA